MSRFHNLAALTACALALVLAGCGGNAGASDTHPKVKSPTPTSQPVPAATPTSTPAPLPSSTATAPPPTPTDTTVPATATSPPSIPAPTVSSASITPGTVTAGAAMQIQVQLHGRASRVEVYLSSGPGGTAPLTFTLAEQASGLWSATGTAPSGAGTYHYSVGVYSMAGTRAITDNDSWNITVNAAVPTAGPQALPADVPLAPPFSYGSPQAAVFSAEGRTVNGSEVVSNSRPDIAASTVAQFYETRFPRAGWTVDESTVPGAGATSFSIVATTGANRVCVASYSNGVVQIFYGSFAS